MPPVPGTPRVIYLLASPGVPMCRTLCMVMCSL